MTAIKGERLVDLVMGLLAAVGAACSVAVVAIGASPEMEAAMAVCLVGNAAFAAFGLGRAFRPATRKATGVQ